MAPPRLLCSSLTSTTCLVVLTVSALCCSARAADTIEVELNSGRRLSGLIGSTSNQSTLNLRIGNSSLWIVQPIPWDRIQSATRNGDSLTMDQLHKEADRLSGLSEGDLLPLPPPPAKEPQLVEPHTPQSVAVAATEFSPPKVFAINVTAVVANWDADVEPDGVIVNIRPLDQQGAIVPTSGSLQLVLAGTRRGRRSFHASELYNSNEVSLIGRWTRRLRMQDIGPNGAFFKLPFGAIDANFDPAVGDMGLIHARLAVAGMGVFQDAHDNILLRTPGFNRDALELSTGQRFLPFEQTGRGTRRAPSTYPSIRP
jgi:hypothetical protein